MRFTVITTVPSAVWHSPTTATAPVRGIPTTAPPGPRPEGPRPEGPRPEGPRPGPQIQDPEQYQFESRRAMLRCIARLLT